MGKEASRMSAPQHENSWGWGEELSAKALDPEQQGGVTPGGRGGHGRRIRGTPGLNHSAGLTQETIKGYLEEIGY